jgi:hypothetical protein
MPLSSFVNPLPDLRVRHLLQFDYPADYHAPRCLPNINVEAPGAEAIYGLLGTPPKEQGHPCIREQRPEAEDPRIRPYQDQVLDIDRPIQINHTGRLSGSFVKYIAHDPYFSVVKIYVDPVAPAGSPPIRLSQNQEKLKPQAQAPNVWYWNDPATRNELLYTAHVVIQNPRAAGLRPEQVYKLVCKWEFWDESGQRRERMPISGFNEAVAFEVIAATENM